MKQPTKKIATKKTNFLEFMKIYSMNYILNTFQIIKNNFNLFCKVCSTHQFSFISTLPIFLYLQSNMNKLALQVYTSKNKKVFILQLTGNKKDYKNVLKENWKKFLDKFNSENKIAKNKIDNNGFYSIANTHYYNSESQNNVFKFQLLVLKNNATIKDFLEIKKYLFAIPNLPFNKKGIYLNKFSDHKSYICYDLPMILKGKSYFLPLLDPMLLELTKLYNLNFSISDKNLNVETKKEIKNKISATKKLLKVSKKIQATKK